MDMTGGEYFNLSEVYSELNEKYFERKLPLSIMWFGSKTRKARRRRILGAYDGRQKLIRIHRILDNPSIPRYFFAYVVFHEMLHHVFPPKKIFRKGWKIHHEKFKDAEKKFQDYALAKNWEKNHRNLFFNQ